jgi:TetR/AcrR family transcriptional repressor of mexJK operon
MRKRTRPRLQIQPRRPRGRPKAEDLQELEARLISVAHQAFALHGYGATSMNAIARSARVSKNTLYARFPSKAALFQAIVARFKNLGDELPAAATAQGKSLADKLRAYATIALRRSLGSEILEINRLILSESHQFPELGNAAWQRFQVGVRSIAQLIEEDAKRARKPSRDPVAAAELFLYCLYGWYTSVITTNRVVSDKELTAWVDRTIRMFLAKRAAW